MQGSNNRNDNASRTIGRYAIMNVCDTGAAIVNTFELIRNTYNENDKSLNK